MTDDDPDKFAKLLPILTGVRKFKIQAWLFLEYPNYSTPALVSIWVSCKWQSKWQSKFMFLMIHDLLRKISILSHEKGP
jgi:hypothetical protein